MHPYAPLCTLVHPGKREIWSSPAGQASLMALIIKDIQLGMWKFWESDASEGAGISFGRPMIVPRFRGGGGEFARERIPRLTIGIVV